MICCYCNSHYMDICKNHTIPLQTHLLSSSTPKLHAKILEFYGISTESPDLPIENLAISSKNKFIGFTVQNTLKIWDLKTKTEEAVLQNHIGRIRSLAISSNSKYITTGGSDRTIRVWDLKKKSQYAVFYPSEKVRSVSISNDNNYIISGGGSQNIGELIIWNLKLKYQEAVLHGHISCVLCVAVSAKSKFIVSGGADMTVRIWSLHERSQETVLQGHRSCVNSVVITENCKYAVSSGADSTVRIWNLNKRCVEAVLKSCLSFTRSVVITCDKKYALFNQYDNTVKVWDLRDKDQNEVLSGCVFEEYTAASEDERMKDGICGKDFEDKGSCDVENLMAIDGKTGDQREYCCIDDMQGLDEEFRENILRFHNLKIKSVVIARGSKYVVSCGADSTIRVWNTKKK